MNLKQYLIAFLLMYGGMIYAGPVTTIRGSIQGASGYEVRLLTWADQVTYIEKKLATSPIDAMGNFNLITDLKSTTYAFFAIGNLRADILLEPGAAYEIHFEDYPSLSILETRNLLLQKESLAYTFLKQEDDKINDLSAGVEQMYNSFLSKHYMDIYLKRTSVTEAFLDSFFLKFGTVKHPWIQKMVDYKTAILKMSAYKITPEMAYNLWISDRDFEYHHPDYMDFFHQVFDHYLTTSLKNYTYDELIHTINNQGSYRALSELVGRDTLLRDELIREMVILKCLGELYHNRYFHQDQVLKILSFIGATSKFPEHRIIASNTIFQLTRFNPGKMAPDFSLPDEQGIPHSISHYKGKYLYLMFYTSNCVPCLAELTYLASIYQELAPDLDVLAVGLDPNPDKLWKTVEQQKFPWKTVHFNQDFELLDRYMIRNYPFFILIAPDGSFDTYGARQPSSQFQPWFEEVVLKQK